MRLTGWPDGFSTDTDSGSDGGSDFCRSRSQSSSSSPLHASVTRFRDLRLDDREDARRAWSKFVDAAEGGKTTGSGARRTADHRSTDHSNDPDGDRSRLSERDRLSTINESLSAGRDSRNSGSSSLLRAV